MVGKHCKSTYYCRCYVCARKFGDVYTQKTQKRFSLCFALPHRTDSYRVLSSRSRWIRWTRFLSFTCSRVCLCLPCMRALLLLFRRFLWHVTAVLYVQYSITPNAPLLITCEHRFSYCIVHCAPKLASRLGFPYITSTRPVVQDFSSKRKRLQKSLKR